MWLNHAQDDIYVSLQKFNENFLYKGFRNFKKQPPILQGCIMTQFIHSFNQKVLEIYYVPGAMLHARKQRFIRLSLSQETRGLVVEVFVKSARYCFYVHDPTCINKEISMNH